MDRHVEFATQLSHLVALYARDPLDRTAEKAALRAARAAAKHGVIELSLTGDALRAGQHEIEEPEADVAALLALLTALGISRVTAPHHAKQEEVRQLAKRLGSVAKGEVTPQAFAESLAALEWKELTIERAAAPSAGTAAVVEEEAPAEGRADSPSETSVATTEALTEAPAEAPAEMSAEVPAEVPAEASAEAPAEAPAEALTEVPAESTAEAPTESTDEAPPGKPLAEQLPPAVAELAGDEYRELFARLITSSEPLTLRRLLEPVQAAIEQTVRDGHVATSARLILAMFACEACADDSEMRRQFVVTLRRLTKPTLMRAYAMLYADAPDARTDLEQVLARFGEDGAEAVADCIGSAPTPGMRAVYAELLFRLPGTNDALLAMLDDQRAIVVERAIALIVEMRHPEMERVLGEQLSSERPRVRLAAVRGLAAARDSSFAADALVRGVQDTLPEVRLAAAIALQSRREERIVPPLLRFVDAEDELDVQLAFVSTLGKIPTADGVQKLIALANPTERMLRRRRAPVLRLGAIEALGEARTPAAMAALQRLLEDKEKDVREAAARLYSRARRQTASLSMPAVN